MSRSRKKTPISGWACCNSAKAWRTQENRRYRAYVLDMMRHQRYDDIQAYCGKFGNEWSSPRDGKGWYSDGKGVKCEDALQIDAVYGYIILWDHITSHYKCDIAYKQQMRK